jgi:hypothetical protein
MKPRIATLALTCLFLPLVGACQSAKLRLPDFQPLADKATDSVNISVSPWLLHTVASLIDDKDADGAATREMFNRIHSIDIRSYEFATDFAYSRADIDAVRRQLTGPGWTQLMQVRDRQKNEDVDIYLAIENNRTTGFALIASEPRQFTIINIVGSISMEDVPKIENYLHVPKGTGGMGAVDLGRVGTSDVGAGRVGTSGVGQQPVDSNKRLSDAGWAANTL